MGLTAGLGLLLEPIVKFDGVAPMQFVPSLMYSASRTRISMKMGMPSRNMFRGLPVHPGSAVPLRHTHVPSALGLGLKVAPSLGSHTDVKSTDSV